MQQLDHIQAEEELTPPRSKVKFIVKPTGEFHFHGEPDPSVIQQLLTSSDYQRDKDRQAATAITNETKKIEQMLMFFLGSSIMLCIICIILSLTNNNQSVGVNRSNVESNIGRTCTY